MSDTIRITASISSDQDQVIGNQWVSMEADLSPVFANVITPLQPARGLIEGVKGAGTGTNEDGVTRDRRN